MEVVGDKRVFHDTCLLADLGLATQASSPRVAANYPWRITAPEAVEGTWSVKSDVWSFGLLIYELLSGKVPWSQCRSQPITFPAMQCNVPGFHPRPDECPDELWALFVSCTQANPQDRPTTTEAKQILHRLALTYHGSQPKTIRSLESITRSAYTPPPQFVPQDGPRVNLAGSEYPPQTHLPEYPGAQSPFDQSTPDQFVVHQTDPKFTLGSLEYPNSNSPKLALGSLEYPNRPSNPSTPGNGYPNPSNPSPQMNLGNTEYPRLYRSSQAPSQPPSSEYPSSPQLQAAAVQVDIGGVEYPATGSPVQPSPASHHPTPSHFSPAPSSQPVQQHRPLARVPTNPHLPEAFARLPALSPEYAGGLSASQAGPEYTNAPYRAGPPLPSSQSQSHLLQTQAQAPGFRPGPPLVQSLTLEAWFHSSPQAELLLQPTPPGTFLVRASSQVLPPHRSPTATLWPSRRRTASPSRSSRRMSQDSSGQVPRPSPTRRRPANTPGLWQRL